MSNSDNEADSRSKKPPWWARALHWLTGCGLPRQRSACSVCGAVDDEECDAGLHG